MSGPRARARDALVEVFFDLVVITLVTLGLGWAAHFLIC